MPDPNVDKKQQNMVVFYYFLILFWCNNFINEVANIVK